MQPQPTALIPVAITLCDDIEGAGDRSVLCWWSAHAQEPVMCTFKTFNTLSSGITIFNICKSER